MHVFIIHSSVLPTLGYHESGCSQHWSASVLLMCQLDDLWVHQCPLEVLGHMVELVLVGVLFTWLIDWFGLVWFVLILFLFLWTSTLISVMAELIPFVMCFLHDCNSEWMRWHLDALLMHCIFLMSTKVERTFIYSLAISIPFSKNQVGWFLILFFKFSHSVGVTLLSRL